ncbi:MAG: hypothetical protein ACOWWR_05795 [Eubacteriales bacterium]
MNSYEFAMHMELDGGKYYQELGQSCLDETVNTVVENFAGKN